MGEKEVQIMRTVDLRLLVAAGVTKEAEDLGLPVA
jgi:hypothetical protein